MKKNMTIRRGDVIHLHGMTDDILVVRGKVFENDTDFVGFFIAPDGRNMSVSFTAENVKEIVAHDVERMFVLSDEWRKRHRAK